MKVLFNVKWKVISEIKPNKTEQPFFYPFDIYDAIIK
jgi:hypothetical protein